MCYCPNHTPLFSFRGATLLPLSLQVILDVVFNHTAEGNEKGPTLSFRGLDNRVYYMLAPLGEYYNYRCVGVVCYCVFVVVCFSVCVWCSCCWCQHVAACGL